MISLNIPLPPQYPNFSNVDVTESNLTMENSVIYKSDGGSPNYKSNRKNGYPHNTHQILPNLVYSINSTYQNLPPKSPKFSYHNIINNCENTQKTNLWRPGESFKEYNYQANCQIPNLTSKKPNQQLRMTNLNEDFDYNYGIKERQGNMNTVASKTRSHPNLMNDYVNLTGTETILNDILCTRINRPLIPVSNIYKPQQINSEHFTTAIDATSSSPEMYRHGSQLYPPQCIPEYAANKESCSTESNRLVNLLLEENKRLKTKLRQSDSRLECVDQLERKIHNLELLFEELLTSQRRQRLLDLQLQQASLANYMVKTVPLQEMATKTNNNDVFGPGRGTTAGDTSRPVDLRKTPVSGSQSIIPSSPIISQRFTEDSPGERSLGFGCKISKVKS